MQKHPSKVNMYAFIPMAVILGIGLGVGGHVLFGHFVATLVGASIGLGVTGAAIYGLSSDFNDVRLSHVEDKLIDLEMKLIEEYGFSDEGNILSVPADKVKDYLKGDYKLTVSYWVEFDNKIESLTTEEIEKLRTAGYVFHKNMDRLKALSPADVKLLLAKGYTMKRNGIETVFVKDEKALQLDCNKADILLPSFNRELTEEDKKGTERLIAEMLKPQVVSKKAKKKDEIIDHENNIVINND